MSYKGFSILVDSFLNMLSPSSLAKSSIADMAGCDAEGLVPIRLTELSCQTSVILHIGLNDSGARIKEKLQDSLGITPDFVRLSLIDGTFFSDADSLALHPECRELHYTLHLDGGMKYSCFLGTISCCNAECKPACLLHTCCFMVGKVNTTGYCGFLAVPCGFRIGLGCCGICAVLLGQKPKLLSRTDFTPRQDEQ